MSKTREKYSISGVDLYHVRNRNELRVIRCLKEAIERDGLDDIAPDAIKDAYAFALNNLPARYTQQGTIVLRDPVLKSTIEGIVSDALTRVLLNPKLPE